MTPNVLVAGSDLPHMGSAGSVVLYRLLAGWPAERCLAVGEVPPGGVVRLTCQFVEFRPFLRRLNFGRLRNAMNCVRAVGLAPAGTLRVGDFEPDIVLSVMSDLSYSIAVHDFAQRKKLPLIWIVHDDPEEFNKASHAAHEVIRKAFRRMYRNAASRLCVSPELEDVLRKRYGAPGTTIYPIRSQALTPRAPCESEVLKNRAYFTLGYAGSLSYGYGPRLIEMAPLLRLVGAKVKIFGSKLQVGDYSDVLLSQGRLATPDEVWDRIKSECDAVLLPYCYANHGHELLLRTHFPSKLTEYLALGMPVLITGPEYATGVKWALRHQDSCVVVREQNGLELVRALIMLRDSPGIRVDLAKRAVVAGSKEFDSKSIKDRFVNHIYQVAGARWEGFGART